jgi:hypothetical protein
MESKDEAGPGLKILKGRARVGREFPDATMHGKHWRASMNLERSQLNGPGWSLLRFEGVPSLCGMDICGVSVPQHRRNFFGVHAIPTQIVATILETPFLICFKGRFPTNASIPHT